ncbi:hypothetical protein U0070_004811 [Myodes glareolus]|uniref:Transmembrane protein 176B n=1 Tax=Myodes glareolus TaxID=447135 RepID=A0AAW0J571_MYOGA
MTQTTVTVNGAEVASTLPTSPHVNIHIHHHSALEQLLRAMGSVKKSLSRPQDTGPSKASIHHGLLALGVRAGCYRWGVKGVDFFPPVLQVTQILLGLVSCVLGVCIYFGPWTELHTFGYAFWSGSVAVVAGTGTIVNEKRHGKLTGHISCLLILACTATAVVATVLGVNSLIWQTSGAYRYKISSTCDSLQTSTDSGDGLVRFTDNTSWETERCREYLGMMMNVFLALCTMLTVVCVLKILVSLASLGLSLRSMCGRSSQTLDKEEAEKKLLGGDSTPPSPTKAIPVIL